MVFKAPQLRKADRHGSRMCKGAEVSVDIECLRNGEKFSAELVFKASRGQK